MPGSGSQSKLGISPELLDQRIGDEAAVHPGHQYPLGANFIGSLERIFDAFVDQRVRCWCRFCACVNEPRWGSSGGER